MHSPKLILSALALCFLSAEALPVPSNGGGAVALNIRGEASAQARDTTSIAPAPGARADLIKRFPTSGTSDAGATPVDSDDAFVYNWSR